MSKPMITGGSAKDVVDAINFFTKKIDFNDKDKATAINKFKKLIENKRFVDDLVRNTINDAFKKVGIDDLKQDFSDSKQAAQFVEKKLTIPDKPPPPPPRPAPPLLPTEALANVAVEAAQSDADINGRIRSLIGEDAPKIDDFTPGPDVPMESYVTAINQRIDAAQAVHDKYEDATQSQALALETAIKESPVANVGPFTAKRMEGGGKRKRRKQTKKKKHKRK